MSSQGTWFYANKTITRSAQGQDQLTAIEILLHAISGKTVIVTLEQQ